MKRLVMMPDGWSCTIDECRPGHFAFKGLLCFKSEYGVKPECFNEAGEYLQYAPSDLVQPVDPVWEEFEP